MAIRFWKKPFESKKEKKDLKAVSNDDDEYKLISEENVIDDLEEKIKKKKGRLKKVEKENE